MLSEEAKLLDVDEPRYLEVDRDRDGLPGSIICAYFAVIGGGKVYMEAVLSLSTYDKPLIESVDVVEIAKAEEVLRTIIALNYANKMKLELALFLINTMNIKYKSKLQTAFANIKSRVFKKNSLKISKND